MTHYGQKNMLHPLQVPANVRKNLHQDNSMMQIFLFL